MKGKKTKDVFPQLWQTIRYDADFAGRKHSNTLRYFFNTRIETAEALTKLFEDMPPEDCYDLKQIS